MDPRIQIRIGIHTKMSWIRNTGFKAMKFLHLHALLARLPLSTVSFFFSSIQNSAGVMVSDRHYFSGPKSHMKNVGSGLHPHRWFHWLPPIYLLCILCYAELNNLWELFTVILLEAKTFARKRTKIYNKSRSRFSSILYIFL
jgi:hypothetical protein